MQSFYFKQHKKIKKTHKHKILLALEQQNIGFKFAMN